MTEGSKCARHLGPGSMAPVQQECDPYEMDRSRVLIEVLSHLADRGVHRGHLKEWSAFVSSHFPDVCAIECGVRNDDSLYITLRIEPYSQELARLNSRLASWIKTRHPLCRKVDFFMRPTQDQVGYSYTATLYPYP